MTIMMTLKCGCSISKSGEFVVGEFCINCKECSMMPKIHPFGQGRLNRT